MKVRFCLAAAKQPPDADSAALRSD